MEDHMNRPLSDLLDEANEYCRRGDFKQAVLRHCSYLENTLGVGRLNANIHPSDQMLIHSLAHHQDAEVALSQYFSVSLQQHYSAMQIYRCFFEQSDRTVGVLDFACGYGRLLRLLTLSLHVEQLWASEIQPDAVEFVTSAFGVRAIPSHVDPDQFEPGRTFDFIWVASLFSHLPDELFKKWMCRLTELLTPRGVLCFSVRSSELLPMGEVMPDSGFKYFRASEVTDLAADVYGTAYASEAYVRGAVATALGNEHPCRRLPKALAHEQDIYVVCKDANRSLDALDAFRRGPWGWVDRRSMSTEGELYLEGWAGSLDDGSVEAVEVRVNGAMYECITDIRRDDVRVALLDERMAMSGWSFRNNIQHWKSRRIEVSARSARGELALLFAGTVPDPV
jgi:SAM-dependent methyltransferase